MHQRSALFFPIYRTSRYHSALGGQSPLAIHTAEPRRTLPADFSIPAKLPITEGQVHFIRAIDQQRQVLILNKSWSAGLGLPGQGVLGHFVSDPTRGDITDLRCRARRTQKTLLGGSSFPAPRIGGAIAITLLAAEGRTSLGAGFLGRV